MSTDRKPLRYAADLGALEWKRDDCRPYGQAPSGYGRKIATCYLVRIGGRGPWRRVYCCIFSNMGTCYVVKGGEWAIVRDYDRPEVVPHV